MAVRLYKNKDGVFISLSQQDFDALCENRSLETNLHVTNGDVSIAVDEIITVPDDVDLSFARQVDAFMTQYKGALTALEKGSTDDAIDYV